MSVTFKNASEVSVTNQYIIPVISLISDDVNNGDVKPLQASKTRKSLHVPTSINWKKPSTKTKSFDPVIDNYYTEKLKQPLTNKDTCIGVSSLMKKRVATDKCVPVIVLDKSSDSSG